ncbi:MAG: DUF4919 domain-containing protein [Desulfobacteraceae bacterium]|nr:DUF4919 domain-containing protein [Desulfobacteraceae bacterium]
MREEFIKFIQTPNRDNYLTCHKKLVSSDKYEPYSDEIDTAGKLCEQHKVEEAKEALKTAMGNLMLSPSAHQLLSFLFHKLGDTESSEFEWMAGQACIAGILSTGDGSVNTPYIVVRTSDEYDVIKHFEKESAHQSLMQNGRKHLDLIKCTDGSEYCFDITSAYNHLTGASSGEPEGKGPFELVLDSAGIDAKKVAAAIKEDLGFTSTEALRLVRSTPVKLSHEIAERVWKLKRIEKKIIAAGGIAHIAPVNEDSSEQQL